MSDFSNNISYPQFLTQVSIKLNSAPQNNDNPDSNYVYEWKTISGNQIYMNYKFHDGTIKTYPLKQSQSVRIEAPNEVQNYIFSNSDIQNGQLIIDNNYSIADVGFFKDSNKQNWEIVSVPIIANENRSVIDFSDIDINDYPYGGIVRFAKGTVIINYQDTIYEIPDAHGEMTFNANNGLIQYANNITGNLLIKKQNIISLSDYQMMKIFIINNGNYSISIDNETIDQKKFIACFMKIGGQVVMIGNIIKIGD